MKVIFFGTPDYVVPILERLYKDYEVIAVVTQPPKKVGREQKLTFSPVDSFAFKHKVPIFFDFEKLPPADLGVCAAFGKMIPEFVISNLPFGILNIHPSLLPKYRGASPIQAAIAAGDTQTGVTIIKMDEKLDHGPIVTQFKEEILAIDTAETLRVRLFEKSAEVLTDMIPNYSKGKISLKPQNHTQATFTKIVTKQDGFIDLREKSPEEIDRFIRAMHPWPGAWTLLRQGSAGQARRLKLLPGGMVQLEGKNPVTRRQFEAVYPDLIGAYPGALLS